MLDLKTYAKDLPHGGVARLAEAVGVSAVYMSQLIARQAGAKGEPREPSPELCVKLEAATDRKVMRWNMRPADWHLIWPELLTHENAPEVVQAA